MTLNRTNGGFTLLEVMIALAIIATVLVTLLGSHLMSLNLAQKHKEQTLIALLARQKLEESFTIEFDSLKSDFGDFSPMYPGYEWEREVESSDVEHLKKVKIIVKWHESEFELETDVAARIIE
jgi:general secretion pathway protein I